tara:strand:+ start:1541 stop:3589 length:2049 start_codon:yes stop_codon:yes gene_type:complete
LKTKLSSKADGSKESQLIVVESRTKAETLQQFLGNEFDVVATVGHIRDLPQRMLGVNVRRDFEPLYVVPPERLNLVNDLQNRAERASLVLLATDPDREGEAIAWHVAEACRLDAKKTRRVEFHEITKTAILRALEEPRAIDENLVAAQQARRILDRLVGFELSPLLNRKIKGARSAGRVQSVALRMVVEREREIRAFVPDEWWSVEGRFSAHESSGSSFNAMVIGVPDKLDISDEDSANQIVEQLQSESYTVESVKSRERQSRPSAPFTTASLQRASSNRLGLSPSQTMRIAQQLYEGVVVADGNRTGLITYMRTDSLNISNEARTEVKGFIEKRYGEDLYPDKPNTYKTKSRNAQEAHEAIRPTSVNRTPEAMEEHLDPSQRRLYSLIWRQFVSSQMVPARLRTVTAIIAPHLASNAPYKFRSSTTEIVFPGHFVVSKEDGSVEEKNRAILSLSDGQQVLAESVEGIQHFTEPPSRYSEAGLIRVMEEEGIGRPSTYAPTIRRINDALYVEREGRALRPTKLGEDVVDALVEFFPEVIDKAFTRRMEDNLDSVASDNTDWIQPLSDFWDPFQQDIQRAKTDMKVVEATYEKLGEDCPECGLDLVWKRSRKGNWFIACVGYPDCDFSRGYGLATGIICPDCGDGQVVERRGNLRGRTTKFFGCVRYPDCKYRSNKRPDGDDD